MSKILASEIENKSLSNRSENEKKHASHTHKHTHFYKFIRVDYKKTASHSYLNDF